MKKLRKLSSNQTVRAEQWNELVDIVNSMLNVRVGPGLEARQTSAGTIISLVRHPVSAISGGGEGGDSGDGGGGGGFFAEITAAEPVSGTNQWIYNWERVQKQFGGYQYQAWNTDGTTGTGYNLIEFMNDGFGVEGNGVDVDGVDFPAAFAIQPCPVGNIVWMQAVTPTATESTAEYWFFYENGIDGTC